jgi:hypothetical protein
MVAVVGFLAFSVTNVLALDVTTCGQHVPDGAMAVLQTDLTCGAGTCEVDSSISCQVDGDCPAGACAPGAVVLGRNASLSLNGHSISSSGNGTGIYCPPRPCPDPNHSCVPEVPGTVTISGPGTISGGAYGIFCRSRRTVVSNVQVENIDFFGAGDGIVVPVLIATNVSVTGSDRGVLASSVRATNLTASSNRHAGISADAVRGSQVFVENNGPGDSRLSFPAGIFATRCRLLDSVVTGNFAGARPIDLLTFRRPVLVRTTCDSSVVPDPTGKPTAASWGVCTND